MLVRSLILLLIAAAPALAQENCSGLATSDTLDVSSLSVAGRFPFVSADSLRAFFAHLDPASVDTTRWWPTGDGVSLSPDESAAAGDVEHLRVGSDATLYFHLYPRRGTADLYVNTRDFGTPLRYGALVLSRETPLEALERTFPRSYNAATCASGGDGGMQLHMLDGLGAGVITVFASEAGVEAVNYHIRDLHRFGGHGP